MVQKHAVHRAAAAVSGANQRSLFCLAHSPILSFAASSESTAGRTSREKTGFLRYSRMKNEHKQ